MTERHYKLKCLGKNVTMIVDPKRGVAFDGYDERAERSLKAFGKKDSSPCWVVSHAVVDGTLDKELTRAAVDANLPLVRALIFAGASAKRFESAALRGACALPLDNPDGNKLVRALVEAGADQQTDIQCALRRAVKTNDHDLIRFLLERDNWVDGNTFIDALQAYHIDAFDMLVDAAQTVESGDNAALNFAVSMKDKKIVSDLLEAGAGDTLSLRYAFEQAAYYHSIPILKRLLQKDPTLMNFAKIAIIKAARASYYRGRPHGVTCFLLEEMDEQGLLTPDQSSDFKTLGVSAYAHRVIDHYSQE